EILRIVIAPAQDHQVLRAAGDEQLAVANEAEVAGAQVGPRAANEARPEGAFGLLVPVPVAESDARAPEPDLSHPAGRPLRAGVRIDDRQILAGPRPAATDEPAPARLARSGRLGAAVLEPGRAEARNVRSGPRDAPGHEQRRLGQAVAGVERLASEAALGEGGGEPVERLGAHRLGAVERHLPAREIEVRALGRADLARAQLVGEVRPAGGRGAGPRDRLEPA